MKRKAFTLIELLVVIAIIALLISILIPALSKAKNSALRVACQANQHSIAQAYHAYASEHDDLFPVIFSAECYFASTNDPRQYSLDSRERFDSYTSPEVFYCPAMSDGLDGIKGPGDRGVTNPTGIVGWSVYPLGQTGGAAVAIGYNLMAGWVESGTSAFDERLYYLSNAAKGTSLEALRPHFKKMPARQTQVKNTAALPLLCDVNKTATNGNVNLDAALTWPWVAYNLENAGRADNNKALNHLMRGGQVIGINSAYADGHVEWRKDDEILPRSRTNRQGVGNTVFWY